MTLSIENICNFLIQSSLIFLIIFLPLAFGAVEVWSITIMELFVLFTVSLWFFRMVNQRNVRFFNTALNLPIFVFIAFCLLTFNLSVYKYATKVELSKLLAFTAVFLTIVNNIQTRRRINLMVGSIIVSGFIVAVLGLVVGYGEAGKIYWLKSNSGIISSLGLYVNRNNFAGLMLMTIPLAMGAMLTNTEMVRKFLYGFMAIVMSTALFLSRSRSGMISFLACLCFITLMSKASKTLRKKNIVIITWILLGMLAIGLAAKNVVVERLTTILNPKQAISLRWDTWSDTAKMVKDFPVFGTGLGTFPHVFPQYKTMRRDVFFTHAENEYIQILSETGILGFSLFLWIVLVFFKKVFYEPFWPFSHKTRKDPYVLGLGLGCLTSVFALSIHNLMHFDLHIPSNAFVLTSIMGLTIAIIYNRIYEGRESSLLTEKRWNIPKGIPQKIGYFSVAVFLISAIIPIGRFYIADSNAREVEWLLADRESIVSLTDIEKLKLAAYLEPGCSFYHYLLGIAYERALQINPLPYEKAIMQEPMNAKYHLRLALIYEKLANAGNEEYFSKAEKEYVKAASLRENEAIYQYYASRSHLERGHKDRMIERVKKMIELSEYEYMVRFIFDAIKINEGYLGAVADIINSITPGRVRITDDEVTILLEDFESTNGTGMVKWAGNADYEVREHKKINTVSFRGEQSEMLKICYKERGQRDYWRIFTVDIPLLSQRRAGLRFHINCEGNFEGRIVANVCYKDAEGDVVRTATFNSQQRRELAGNWLQFEIDDIYGRANEYAISQGLGINKMAVNFVGIDTRGYSGSMYIDEFEFFIERQSE